MRPPRKGTPFGVWILLVVLAGVLQLPLIEFLHLGATMNKYKPDVQTRRPVRLTMDFRKQRPTKKIEPKPEPIDGQIVSVRQPEKEQEAPKKTRHLSDFNTRVKKETKARPNRKSRSKRLGAVSPHKPSRLQSPQSKSLKESSSPKQQKKKTMTAKRLQESLKKRGDMSSKTELVRNSTARALLPSLDRKSTLANLQTLTGSAANDDWLPRVKEEGAQTMLNSRRFQHWDFFNTVKSRVRKHWKPAHLYRRRDPTGKVYGIKDRLTVVEITLDPKGYVTRLTTVKDSGVDFLDHEARRALRSAGPFSNPPNGLLNKHGAVRFQFGFLFEISSSRFKFFRIR
ncbi:MAG TPA: energy transducer TonB [Myxococcales bacterium]|nr:energy transducer TonB [Myxococcales bacterium]